MGTGQIRDLPKGNAYRSYMEHRGQRRCGFSIQAWAAYGCPPVSVLVTELVGGLILTRVVV